MTTPTTTHIDDVHAALMQTLHDLRNRDAPMEVDRARAVAQVAGVLVDSARVEVEFARAAGNLKSNGHPVRSSFLGAPERVVEQRRIPSGTVTRTSAGVTRHEIADDDMDDDV